MIVSYSELIEELKIMGVQFMTKAEVLSGVEPETVGIVLQHDVDSGKNLLPLLDYEQRANVKSSVYLLPDGNNGYYKYDYEYLSRNFPEHEFGLHFGVKKHFEECPFEYETVSPHGVHENGEYSKDNSFVLDRELDNGNYGFVRYCKEKWNYDDEIKDVRYYTKSGKTWADFPCEGVFIINDSCGVIAPYSFEEALSKMKEGVFLFLIHPENLNGGVFFNKTIKRKIETVSWQDRQDQTLKDSAKSKLGYFSVAENVSAVAVGEILKNYTGKGLDVGCGILEKPAYMSDNIDWYGIDPYIGEHHQFNFTVGVAEDMPYKDGEFDVILFATSMDHVIDPNKAIKETYRVLNPGGYLFVWFSPRGGERYSEWKKTGGMYDRHHEWAWSHKDMIIFLEENGFKYKETHDLVGSEVLIMTRGKDVL